MTVQQAVLEFISNNSEFSGVNLCNYVRTRLNRPYLMDGTIMRRLRELREFKNIICISIKESKYKVEEYRYF
jgi:hypothetical protein